MEWQVVHGCRQLVLWNVKLSLVTSATHVSCCCLQCLRETADQHRRKVWMMSSQHAPYILGYTRTTMVGTMSCEPAKASQSQKPYLSSDCTLQLEYMKVESLVIAGQHTAVNTFPGLVHTARHTMEVDSSLSRYSNPLGRGCRRQGWWLGWSRNKVAVLEGVAGIPPF